MIIGNVVASALISISVFLLAVPRPALAVVVPAPVVPAGAEQAEMRQIAAANPLVRLQTVRDHSHHSQTAGLCSSHPILP